MRALIVLLALVALLVSDPIRADAGNCPAPVYAYSVTGDITEENAAYFTRFVKRARAAGAARLAIDISTEGGDASAAIAMYRALRESGVPSVCTARGVAASGGFLVLQSCDRRLAAPGTTLATHRPFVVVKVPPGFSAQVTVEKAAELYHWVTSIATVFDRAIADRLRMPVAKYLERVGQGKTWSMTAPEALQAGAIDGIVE